MGHNNRVAEWLPVMGTLFVGILAEINYRRLSRAVAGGDIAGGKVSIIVPARNEERRIGPLLQSLRQLNYADYEVVVVDDASTDSTAVIAGHFGATVITVRQLPDGWTGKAHACWQGACNTRGEWLLFTDADTVHHSKSLSVAIASARASGAGLVSFLCRQRCESFWEKLLLPYAYALYFAGRVTMNTSEQSAVANGQYILMRRAEYDRMGGHRAIRGSVIDDVALARRAHVCDISVLLQRGEEWVDVRMYEGLKTLWEGLSKNAVSFVIVAPGYGALTVAASVALGAAFPGALRAKSRFRRIALLASPTVVLIPWMRRFGVPLRYVPLYPLAAAVFQLMAFDSIRRSLRTGGIEWKGRRY